MKIDVDLQIVCQNTKLPSAELFQQWTEAALIPFNQAFELTIRIVNCEESQQLNMQYRNKDKPTNVLSFPFEVPEGISLNLLGDLIICADIVEKEALEQGKMLMAHWAHMVIHGSLHLCGFDHIDNAQAQEMESIEIDILAKLGFNNPYIEI